MSGNKFQGHCIDNQVTPTTSMVFSRSSTKEANRSKRRERRIQWNVNDNNLSLEQDSKRRTIHHSVTSTDLTKAVCGRVGKSYDKNQKSIANTKSVEACGANDQKDCERYGLVATPGYAGTFKMSIVADGVCGPDGKCLVEFTVWKKIKSPELRRLWFTVRHRMSPAAAVGIRALEVWVDRKDDYPTKVVFLHK